MKPDDLLFMVGAITFWPALALSVLGYIKKKTYSKWVCVSFAFDAVANGIERHWFWVTLDWAFSAYGYYQWRNSPDDDDKPKRKRAALRSKFDKVLPKPVVAPVRVGLGGTPQ